MTQRQFIQLAKVQLPIAVLALIGCHQYVSVEGRIESASGGPIAGAEITLTGDPITNPDLKPQRATSTDDGRFVISLSLNPSKPSTAKLSVNARGYKHFERVFAPEIHSQVTITLEDVDAVENARP